MNHKLKEIKKQIQSAQNTLMDLEKKRKIIKDKIRLLTKLRETLTNDDSSITKYSSEKVKITLFRSLFKGRTDVFPKRFESKKTGKSGYQPACKNEWVLGLCKKPKVKCVNCDNREFIPFDGEIIEAHLVGKDLYNKDFSIGVYPLLEDETCWFLAVDFDNKNWQDDVSAFYKTCKKFNIPAYIERSRSGKGAHIWFFFSEALPAFQARKFGSYILTETMEIRPELGLKSYDRLFPSQDTLPKGGFGNLIALPLQKKPRENKNSVFVNEEFELYQDQWDLLSSIKRINREKVTEIVSEAVQKGQVIGVKTVEFDEVEKKPWKTSPSRKQQLLPIKGPLPKEIKLILGNQIFIEKKGLPAGLINRIIRIAAFQNPEFYKAQAMRLPIYNKPRIISCSEDFTNHIGIPMGCQEDLIDLLKGLNISVSIQDERNAGFTTNFKFKGHLRAEQKLALNALLDHDSGVLSANTAFGKNSCCNLSYCGQKNKCPHSSTSKAIA